QAMIFPAMKTGKLTIFTGAMARELLADGSGKVTAVSYVDKATRAEKQIRCRAVVVAASACESARLLLNSKSARFSNGLANSSGVVGLPHRQHRLQPRRPDSVAHRDAEI